MRMKTKKQTQVRNGMPFRGDVTEFKMVIFLEHPNWVGNTFFFFFKTPHQRTYSEGKRGRTKGRETLKWEKHQSVASRLLPNWGLFLQPGHVTCPGIRLATFGFMGQCSKELSPPTRAIAFLLKATGLTAKPVCLNILKLLRNWFLEITKGISSVQKETQKVQTWFPRS